MGNANSTATTAAHRITKQLQRSGSPAPSSSSSSQHSHKATTTAGRTIRRKSLELPDLVHLTNLSIMTTTFPTSPLAATAVYGRDQVVVEPQQPRSACIPIPNATGSDMHNRPRKVRQDEDEMNSTDPFTQASTHIPLPHGNPHAQVPTTHALFRGTQEATKRFYSSRLDSARPSAAQLYGTYDLTNNLPQQPPPSRNTSMAPSMLSALVDEAREDDECLSEVEETAEYRQIVVRSSIPQPQKQDDGEPVLVQIAWNGGGNKVYIARAGDKEWKERREMFKSEAFCPHTITIPLLAGTHHIRFLVDGIWRVADDLPTAVDDSGSLANYVAVGLDGGVSGGGILGCTNAEDLAPAISTLKHTAKPLPALLPGQSFWSASSTGDGEYGPSEDIPTPRMGNSPNYRHSPEVWTNQIPEALCSAVDEEEIWHERNSKNLRRGPRGTITQTGFITPLQHPRSPSLPRQLESPSLILNVRPKSIKTVEHPSRLGRSHSARKSRRLESTPTALSPISTSNHNTILDDTVSVDDHSVLPVPSHAVIHHLATSAIHDEVLAIATTNRYLQKYMSTVYYKPIDSDLEC